jgi:hypothetical protein
MQGTADFHHHVANPRFPHPKSLFEHAAAFDTAVDMLDAHAPPRDPPIRGFLRPCQRVAAGLLRRLDDIHAVQCERLKTQILQQLTPRRQWIRRGIGDALIMHTARMRLTQKQNTQGSIDQQEVFERMPLFLAAITRFLFRRIVGARDGSLGAVVTKRGAAAGGAAGASSAGKCGSATPSCSRKASTLRQGASPKVRRVLRNTGSKT